MRPIWYGIPQTSPRIVSPALPPSKINRAVQWLRTREPYQWSFWFLTQRLLPGAFLVAVGYAALAFVSQVTFAVRDSWGQVCGSAGVSNLKKVSSREEGRVFRTNVLCTSTGLEVEKGATYRLHITIPAGDPWTDSGRPAGPNGVPPKEVSLPMTAGVLLRRHLGQPWLKPMAKIGVSGRDEYPLDPLPSLALDEFLTKARSKSRIDTCSNTPADVPNRSPEDKAFTTEIVARSSGELFLYLNDAIFLPVKTKLFYCNNEGSAHVTVERVLPPPL